jgi:hypothetical protein
MAFLQLLKDSIFFLPQDMMNILSPSIIRSTCQKPLPVAIMVAMSTKDPPKQLGAAHVVTFTMIDSSHRRTGKTRHLIGGRQLGSAAGLAIARYDGERGFYLFHCDAYWNPFASTWHETVEDAKTAAEFEYEGVSQTWQVPL